MGKHLSKLNFFYLQGNDKYPKTLETAHTILLNFKYDTRNYGNNKYAGKTHDGVACVTVTDKNWAISLSHVTDVAQMNTMQKNLRSAKAKKTRKKSKKKTNQHLK